jgi:predicted Zn-dependent protease
MKKPRTVDATKRRRRLGVTATAALALAAALITIPNAASAYSLHGYKWPDRNLRIYMNTTSTGNFRNAINQASSNYTSATDVNLTNTTTGGPRFTARDYDAGATDYEGWTDVVHPGGRVESAQSMLNRHYLAGKSVAQLKVVWMHELGHGLGINHVSPTARVMHNPATGAYNAGVRNLTSDDIAGINNLY